VRKLLCLIVEPPRRTHDTNIEHLTAAMDVQSAQRARETLDIAFEISKLLNTGLDRDTLSVLIALCENGVNPEALAAVVKELRREAAALKAAAAQKAR
jgi:mitotic-spindle organizing protein 1